MSPRRYNKANSANAATILILCFGSHSHSFFSSTFGHWPASKCRTLFTSLNSSQCESLRLLNGLQKLVPKFLFRVVLRQIQQVEARMGHRQVGISASRPLNDNLRNVDKIYCKYCSLNYFKNWKFFKCFNRCEVLWTGWNYSIFPIHWNLNSKWKWNRPWLHSCRG